MLHSLFAFCLYSPMQLVTPKVVAMAVSTVITIWRIFPQMFLLLFSLLLIIVRFWFLVDVFFICHPDEPFLRVILTTFLCHPERSEGSVYIHGCINVYVFRSIRHFVPQDDTVLYTDPSLRSG